MGRIALSTSNQSSDQIWQLFVEKGVMPRKGLRPEVARSWQRSRGIDPWQIKQDILSYSSLQARREQYSFLIEVANPIMQDICSLGGQNFVLLCDTEGYVLDTVSNVEYPQPIGQRLSEDTLGTNAIGLALVEGNAVELKGYEHYSSRYHSFSCAASPIRNEDGSILGIIDISNPYGDLPANVMKILGLGVKLIENQLRYRAEKIELQKIQRSYSAIIDVLPECMLLVDSSSGKIINANQKFLQMLGQKDKNQLIGRFLGDLISCSPVEINGLLSSEAEIPDLKLNFSWKNRLISCNLFCKRSINLGRGKKQMVLAFNQGQEIERERTAIYPLRATEPDAFDSLIGNSAQWTYIKHLARRAAPTASSILIQGESGTGKELLARAIHQASGRKGEFIAINCGAIPRELLQSELYGYEEGAFTGARRGGSLGKIDPAQGGTVFLDEIGEMPPDMQVSLLRFLQDRTITRVGGTNTRKIEVRVIAATNRDLNEAMRNGSFRKDLYYRLSVINIELPPLRERKEDIPLMAHYMVRELCLQQQLPTLDIDDEALKALVKYDWPGNARELNNVLEHAVVLSEGDCISRGDLPGYIFAAGDLGLNKAGKLEEYEKEAIINALRQCEGNISHTAKTLGVARNTLYRKLRKFGINADVHS
jgi:transcriptional regulator of acetoin/glycerol metabolism